MPEKTEEELAQEAAAAKEAETKAAEEKAAADKKAAEEAKAGPAKFTIKVDGVEREVTKEELVELAQKSGGADKRFAEAAEKLKKSEKWATVGELFTKISDPEQTPTKEEIAQLAALLDLKADDLSSFLEEEDPEGKKKAALAAAAKKKLKIEDLPEEIQAILAGSKKSQIEAAVEEVKKTVGEALDKDEILGKIIIDSSDANSLKTALSEMIFEDVQRRILAGEQYGPELIKTSVQKVRARVSKLGTQSKKEDGLSLGILGLGPSGQLPEEVQADKPIERVPSTDPKYEDNFLSRFIQKQLQSRTKK